MFGRDSEGKCPRDNALGLDCRPRGFHDSDLRDDAGLMPLEGAGEWIKNCPEARLTPERRLMVAEVVCCDATALSRRARPLKRAWTPAVGGRPYGCDLPK